MPSVPNCRTAKWDTFRKLSQNPGITIGPNGCEAIETPGLPLEEVARGIPQKGNQGGGTNRKSRAMPQWIVVQ